MSQYPPNDSAREPGGFPAARIASVVPDSPAYDAGFEVFSAEELPAFAELDAEGYGNPAKPSFFEGVYGKK